MSVDANIPVTDSTKQPEQRQWIAEMNSPFSATPPPAANTDNSTATPPSSEANPTPPVVVNGADPLDANNTGIADATALATPPAVVEPPVTTDTGLNFSFDLPTSIDEPVTPAAQPQIVPVVETELSKLVKIDENTPEWIKTSLADLESDTSISQEDKQSIAQLPPNKWSRVKNWEKNSKTVSNFLNNTVPIDTVLNDLKSKSGARASQLENHVVASMVSNPQELERFAVANPEQYKKLMLGLANSSEDTVKAILESKGYRVEKADATPIGNDLLALLESNDEYSDDWGHVKGTKVEDLVKQILSRDAAREVKFQELQANAPEKLVAQTDNTPEGAFTPEQQQGLTTISSEWGKVYSSGLAASGIVPPTEQQMKDNPESGMLRQMAYEIAVNGMGSKLPSWDEHLYAWGMTQDDYKDIDTEVSRLITEGKVSDAVNLSKGAAASVYKFAQLRAKVPAIQSALALAKKLESGVVTPKPPEANPALPVVPVNTNNGQQQQQDDKTRFAVADSFLHKTPNENIRLG